MWRFGGRGDPDPAEKKKAETIRREGAREIDQLLRVIFRERRKTGRLDPEATEMATRSCGVPGMAIEAAHQVIAEVGPQAVAFPSAAQLSSWVGFCPGQQEGAGVSQSDRSPKGNRVMWRWIIQVAWAAVKMKDCRFQHLFRRLIPKLGKKKAIWAVADRCGRFFEGAASALKRLQTLPSAAW